MELEELKKMKETVETRGARRRELASMAASARSRRQLADAATSTPHRRLPSLRDLVPRIPQPEEEVAHQAGRHAAVVQGAQRHPHQGAVRRGAGGPLPPAKIQLMSEPEQRRRARRHRAALRRPPRGAARPADQGHDRRRRRRGARCSSTPALARCTTSWPRRWSPTCPRARR